MYRVNIHRLLNRLDIEKDAFYSNSPMTKRIDRFKIIADALFSVLPKTECNQSFAYIINMLEAYNSKSSNVIQVGGYSNKSNLEFLPNEIKIGIQDAGLSPTRYNKSIMLVITPASYIDPANRSSGEIMFGFDSILTNIDFTGIGISQIPSISEWGWEGEINVGPVGAKSINPPLMSHICVFLCFSPQQVQHPTFYFIGYDSCTEVLGCVHHKKIDLLLFYYIIATTKNETTFTHTFALYESR